MKRIRLISRILIAISLGIVVGIFAPEWIVRTLSTFNHVFNNFLGFMVPLIIIGLITSGIASMGSGSGKTLGVLTASAYLSTIIAGTIAFFVSKQIFPNILGGQNVRAFSNPEGALLSTYFSIDFPPVIGIMGALLLSFILGIGMSRLQDGKMVHIFHDFRQIIEKVIQFVIIPLLPLHIFGIFSNIAHGGQIGTILASFFKVFIMIIALHITYLIAQYSIAGGLTKKNPFMMLKTMIPAYMAALGLQSSASAIPITLERTKKMGTRESIADFAVPLLSTIHLSGSMITITSCAIAVLFLQGDVPTFGRVLPFILMLGITMIAAPGVPGGAVMAALGVLESMLGFDQTMLSLMIALYITQDSFGTACNVTGDGAIAAISDRITYSKKPILFVDTNRIDIKKKPLKKGECINTSVSASK